MKLLTLAITLAASAACIAKTGPWDVKALEKAPDVRWIDTKSPVRSLVYQGLPYAGKPTSVFAYYATPGTLSGDTSKDKRLPAIIYLHGGGGKAWRDVAWYWASRGYAAIAMDLGGCDDKGRLPDGGPDQNGYNKFRHITKPTEDQWPYHAVADAILAASLLRSFPEIDGERIGLTGSSWGGFLTCITAGLDRRLAAAAPVYGCGFVYEKSIWNDEMGLFAEMTPEDRQKWVKLWDPSRYIGQAKMPMLFVYGTSDFAYPLESAVKTCLSAPKGAPRWLSLHSPLQHDDFTAAYAKEVAVFMDQCMKGDKPLAKLGAPVQGNGYISVEVESDTPISSAALFYTSDRDTPSKLRRWTKVSGTITGRRAVTPAPPAGCYGWYVGVTDSRGAVVSTPAHFAATGK